MDLSRDRLILELELELYNNNFGGTKLKINYIWGVREQKGLNTTPVRAIMCKIVSAEELPVENFPGNRICQIFRGNSTSYSSIISLPFLDAWGL
jgi:hypothetical protein